MLSEMVFAEGVSGWWYALLWIELVPFLVMTGRLFLPRAGVAPPGSFRLTFSLVLACALMVLTSLAAVVMFVRAGAAPGPMRWVVGLGVHFVVWAFLGSAMILAAMQALGADSSIGGRRLAALAATTGALLIHAVTLFATWYSRVR